jgi:hypothetical protein
VARDLRRELLTLVGGDEEHRDLPELLLPLQAPVEIQTEDVRSQIILGEEVRGLVAQQAEGAGAARRAEVLVSRGYQHKVQQIQNGGQIIQTKDSGHRASPGQVRVLVSSLFWSVA